MANEFDLDQYITSETSVSMEKTIEFPLEDVRVGKDDKPVILISRFAGVEYNKKLARAHELKYGKGYTVDHSDADAVFESIFEFWPGNVTIGWVFFDKDGVAVPFTIAGCRSVLRRQYINDKYVIRDYIASCMSSDNFKDLLTKEDGEKLAKKSSKSTTGKSQTATK